MNYENGDKYDGEYKNDIKDGNGIFYYKNGDVMMENIKMIK